MSIRPDPKNANKGTQRGRGLLEKSLREYGAGRSVLADKHGTLIAGNKTHEVATEIGLPVRIIQTDGNELVVVQRTDLDLSTDKAATELGIADNRVGQVSLEWDIEVLADLAAEEIDLSKFWSEDEIAALLGTPSEVKEAEPAVDRAEELRERWGVEPGDLWEVGRHRFLCGDATVVTDVERLLDGVTPQMVFSDPPYGISIVAANVSVGGGEVYDIPFGGRKGLGSVGGAKPFGSKATRGSDGAANVVDVGKYLPIANDDTTDTAVNAYTLLASLYPKAVHVWWGGNYYANALPPSPCWIVWDKENTGNFADCELAWTNQPTAVRMFRHRWNGMLKDSEQGQRRVHPTQKPVALAAWCMEAYGKSGDVILDPFLGSAMSAVAAEQIGRTCYGLEVEPLYIAVAIERLTGLGLDARRLD